MTVVSTAAAVTSSSATSSAASSLKSSSHTGLISGLAIGLGLGALLFVALVLFILRSRRRRREALASNSDSIYAEKLPPWSANEEAKELPSPPLVVTYDPIKNLRSELADGQTPGHEMPSDSHPPTELDGNPAHQR